MTVTRGSNKVFNGSFDIEAVDAFFPMGWVPLNGDLNTRFEWSREKAIYGEHTVLITNKTYLESMVGIVMDERYSIDVEPEEEYEVSVWLATERADVPLRVMVIFMEKNFHYHSEAHFKFISGQEMKRYEGVFTVPEGVHLVKLAIGVHDNQETLPSKLWISWAALRKIT